MERKNQAVKKTKNNRVRPHGINQKISYLNSVSICIIIPLQIALIRFHFRNRRLAENQRGKLIFFLMFKNVENSDYLYVRIDYKKITNVLKTILVLTVLFC